MYLKASSLLPPCDCKGLWWIKVEKDVFVHPQNPVKERLCSSAAFQGSFMSFWNGTVLMTCVAEKGNLQRSQHRKRDATNLKCCCRMGWLHLLTSLKPFRHKLPCSVVLTYTSFSLLTFFGGRNLSATCLRLVDCVWSRSCEILHSIFETLRVY